MKDNYNNQIHSYKRENQNRLSTDINNNRNSLRQNNKLYQKNNIKEMNSVDIETLLDRTQNSLDDFVTSLTQEKNMIKKSSKPMSFVNNGLYKKVNKINSSIDNCSYGDSNMQKIYNYDKDIKAIIATQRKLLGNNNENYRTINTINKMNKSNNNITKSRKINRKKVNNNNFDNKNKKLEISSELNNQLLINDFSKRSFNKKDISPIGIIENINSSDNHKSFDDNINEIYNYKKIIDTYNKKNKLLKKENEQLKKQINFLKNFKHISDNLKKENIRLKENLKQIKNTIVKMNLSITKEYFSINRKNNMKNKELVSNLKKEIKNLKEELNKYKNDNKINKAKNNCGIEHDINNEQFEKINKENNDLKEQNIFLINELNNIKKNQDFILANNFLDKKNKSLNIQISNLKKKLQNFNNLQIYIKLFLQNKKSITDEKELFLIRKIQEELGLIQQKQKSGQIPLQFNNNHFSDEIIEYDDNIYNINE